MTVILASGSESRRRILTAAGVPFTAQTPHVDEARVKASLTGQGAAPAAIASGLAERKALRISGRHPEALVIGCDQLLVCDERLFDKAESPEVARDVLRALRGKRHELITATVLARGEKIVWEHVETSRLWMRDFSDAFLEQYLVDEAEHILLAVGCYRIEGQGAQLFARVEGDVFAIRGLPLVPLLQALRERGQLPP